LNSFRAVLLFAIAAVSLKAQTVITTPSPLPTGIVGVPYSQTIAATSPYVVWSTSGNVPPGLGIDFYTGVFSGSPSLPGTYVFTVTAFDESSSASKQFQLKVNPQLFITVDEIFQGQVGMPFNRALTAAGGETPYAWTLVNGTSLPAGLTLNPVTGTMTGTPAGPPGQFFFDVTLRDSASPAQTSGPVRIEIIILPGVLTITTTSPLPDAVQGRSYTQSLTSTGGTAPVSWTLASGNLPAGLALSSAGLLSGTPSQSGSFSFTVRVNDSGQQAATRTFGLQVIPPLMITTGSPLPPGQVSSAYSQQLAAAGGIPPYANWTLTAGALPSGLTLSSGGAITGTPASAGNFSFTVRVQDSTPSAAANFATKSFDLQIAVPTLTISTGSPLPAGQVNSAYSQQLATVGGTPPYSNWTVTGGALPTGLALSSGGAITGTPASAGNFSFMVRVQDSTPSTTPNFATKTFTLQIAVQTLSITTGSPLPSGQVAAPYLQQLAAVGGTPPYTNWTVAGGELPSGLALSSGGAITGTPSSSGSFSLTVRVQDSTASETPNFATKTFNLQIGVQPLIITTGSPLPGAEPGAPYNLTFAAQGGTTPYSWSLQSGSFPPGLSLSNAGVLSGDLTSEGTFTFAVRVRDAANLANSKIFSLAVARVKRPFEIGTTSLPDGTAGVFYAASVFARGGSEPYSFSITGLPPGVQSNTGGGIDGVPTRAGTYSVRVSATDADRAQASATFTIVIKPGQIEIFTIGVPEGRVDASYSAVFGARGGVPTYIWALGSGSLPAGLSLSSSGDLSGTPTELGSFTFSVQVTDQEKQSATKGFTLVIRSAVLTITTATLPNGAAGSSYSASLAAAGGTKPYKWALSGGVPAGLAVNADSGDISGTPATAGTYTFTAQAGDAASQSANKSFTITISPALVITTSSPLPSLTVGTAGSAAFAAAGGAGPYTWSIAGGSIPTGMNFASGQLTGTPAATGSFNFTVQVTDVNKANTSKAFTLEVLPGITITTDRLPNGAIGTAYSASLSATGGVAPYRWSATGSLPPGLTVDETGGISGRPTAAGSYGFTVQVRDSTQPNAGTSSRSLTIVISLPEITGVIISGVPVNPSPAQQPRITLSIGSPFPADVSGTVTLTFAPDAANNADDPAIQFSTGGRTASFTIPAGQTQAVFRAADLLLQTGTVAGTITTTTSLTAAGNPVTCSCSLVQTMRIARAAPVISSVRVVRTANGFNLIITGFSSTREITRAVFRFSGATSLQTNEVTIPISDLFNQYYRGNTQFGGQFVLTAPFVIQGQAGDVTSVSVILSNTVGDSQASTASL
jgi:large repetitive protein